MKLFRISDYNFKNLSWLIVNRNYTVEFLCQYCHKYKKNQNLWNCYLKLINDISPIWQVHIDNDLMGINQNHQTTKQKCILYISSEFFNCSMDSEKLFGMSSDKSPLSAQPTHIKLFLKLERETGGFERLI